MEPNKDLIRKAFEDNKIKLYTSSDIVIDKKIGEGSFGTVFKAKLGDNKVAIKLLDKIDFKTDVSGGEDEVIRSIINELKAMTKIEHEQIPKFYGVYETVEKESTVFGLIFSFIEGVTLQRFLTDNKNMSNITRCEILLGLLNVISVIHKNGVIHRDIKPENVMITPEKGVVLLDFGISKISEKTVTYTNGRRMTPKYSAPEALIDRNDNEDPEFAITKKFDVWSIGCVISEMFSGVNPWSNKFKDDHRILFAMQKGAQFTIEGFKEKTDFPFDKTFPIDFPEVFELANKCLVRNVSKRLTSDELIIELNKLLEFYKSKEK